MNLKLNLLFILIFLTATISAQKIIKLKNFSFEDFPRPGNTPSGWFDCGRIDFPDQSPPDVHPIKDNIFGITQTAFHGDTYLGMVVRENETWESVSQKLKHPLKKGKCYTFSIYMSRSDTYLSPIRGSDEKKQFTEPLILRIWGGDEYCDKAQLLAESDEVYNTIWERFTFYFIPNDKVKYIRLEAFFTTPRLQSPNGNILLDYASPFKEVSCEDVEMKFKMVREKINYDSLEMVKQIEIKKNEVLQKAYDETRGTIDTIEELGNEIRFKKNKLTSKGETKLKTIAGHIEDLSVFKLLFDFNGVKPQSAKLRKESVLNVLKQTGLSEEDYEILGTQEEEEDVIWMVNKKGFYLGILKKK